MPAQSATNEMRWRHRQRICRWCQNPLLSWHSGVYLLTAPLPMQWTPALASWY